MAFQAGAAGLLEENVVGLTLPPCNLAFQAGTDGEVLGSEALTLFLDFQDGVTLLLLTAGVVELLDFQEDVVVPPPPPAPVLGVTAMEFLEVFQEGVLLLA